MIKRKLLLLVPALLLAAGCSSMFGLAGCASTSGQIGTILGDAVTIGKDVVTIGGPIITDVEAAVAQARTNAATAVTLKTSPAK